MTAVPITFWLICVIVAALVAAVVWLLGKQNAQALLAQQQNEFSALQSELSRARAETEQAQASQHQLQDQYRQLQNHFQAASEKAAALEAENKQIPALTAQLNEAVGQIQTLQQNWRTADSRLAAAAQQIANWEKRGQQWAESEQAHNTLRQNFSQCQMQVSSLQAQLSAQSDKLAEWESREESWKAAEVRHQDTQKQLSELKAQYSSLNTQLQNEREAHEEKLSLLLNAKEELTNQFKTLANEILEEKSQRFSRQNQESLTQLLNPLHERVEKFSKTIQETYEKESKERNTLESELKRLQQLNTQLHGDAKALTSALIGTQNKNQGNWGEMILEKVLESSGLQKGREYEVQAASTVTDENGGTRRLQPDVVVHLPENKHIIIDSKVSLTAYVRYTQAAEKEEAAQDLAAHVRSVRQHIKELAEKRYDQINGLNSPDFVLMFIPVEPAYLLALQADNQLFEDCFAKRIMLVGPSTLLATLRTVAGLWRSEQQNQNALLIAKEGGKLYDKLVSFTESFKSIGKNLEQAQGVYDKALKQLRDGRGSALKQAQKLHDLGVQSSKTLSKEMMPDDSDDVLSLPDNDD